MIPLVDKEAMIRSKRALTKTKNNKYGYMKKKALGLIPWIYEKMEIEADDTVNVEAREIANKLGLADKSNGTIYAGLRYLLFFEGINVSIKNNGKTDSLIMTPISGWGHGLSESTIKIFDNMEMDGWYIRRNDLGISFKHSIIKRKDCKDDLGNDMYMLESDGDIYFDRRDLTEEQAITFAKYMSSKDIRRAPDFVYFTPINLVVSDDYIQSRRGYVDIDLDKIGREFRIVRSGDGPEFIATSIYGKECVVYEHDIDEVIKGCSVHRILYSFDRALMIEKAPERIEILKKILPEIKTKYSAIIKNHVLIIVNSAGTFHISIVDGTLHKIYDENFDIEKRLNSKYVCVGPRGDTENFIVFNGTKFKIDRIMSTILAKAIMLLEEKYPDATTILQIRN